MMQANTNTQAFRRLAVAIALATAFPAEGQAQDAAALKREIDSLRDEVRQGARAAQEWRNASSTKHFAGYADVGYADTKGRSGLFNVMSFNPAFHYQYRDLVMLDAELEIAAAEDGTTETGLEFATIGLLIHDYAVLYAGKFNSGIGQFRQNLHPGWINRLPSVPVGFGHDQAAPATELGAGVRGALPFGSMRATYDVWLGNGPRLELNAAGDEIEMIESEGATSNADNKKVLGTRIALLPLPKLELGLSAARGDVAVVQAGVAEAARDYRVAGADAAYQLGGLDLRAEHVEQKVGEQPASMAPMGGRWRARYAQAAYRFASTGWEGVLRYGKYTTPHADQDQKQWAAGVNYWFAPNLVAKAAYESNKGLADTPTDANRVLLQLAYGF
jgi:hypothetical protein